MPIYQDNRELKRRLAWLRAMVMVALILFGIKLWSLGVLEYEHYRQLAEKNRLRTFPQLAPRGLIYDRDERVLVDNVYGFNLLLFRDETANLKDVEAFLARELQIPTKLIQDRLAAARNYPIYRPIVLKEDLSMEEIAFLLAHQSEHPELGILKQPRRLYRYGTLAAHALGYVGEISPEQLRLPRFAGSHPGDLVGRSGLERTYNRRLTGHDGRYRVLVDSRGRSIREVERVEPIPGSRLDLTLDLDLEAAAEEGLGKSKGAVFAFDPRNGEVLVMASRPTFNPTRFAGRLSRRDWDRLRRSPDSPLQNRVTQTAFSPGSVIKLVLAVAGLDRGVVGPETSFFCDGGASFYGHYFRCWKPGGHGRVTLLRAIRDSCNVYFYHLGQRLGIEQIAHYSRLLGLGRPVGLDLPDEAAGLVPTPAWKEKTLGQPWFPGETISVAIGQGPFLVTPAQMARAVGVIATGHFVRLHLARHWREEHAQPLPSVSLPPQRLELVRQAMWEVVNGGGTGGRARVAGFNVCGKTGTAQVISADGRRQLAQGGADRFRANSWFVGFAPRRHPEIVIAVIVQGGGSGGGRAATIARKVLRLYREKHRPLPSPVQVASRAGKGRTS